MASACECWFWTQLNKRTCLSLKFYWWMFICFYKNNKRHTIYSDGSNEKNLRVCAFNLSLGGLETENNRQLIQLAKNRDLRPFLKGFFKRVQGIPLTFLEMQRNAIIAFDGNAKRLGRWSYKKNYLYSYKFVYMSAHPK